MMSHSVAREKTARAPPTRARAKKARVKKVAKTREAKARVAARVTFSQEIQESTNLMGVTLTMPEGHAILDCGAALDCIGEVAAARTAQAITASGLRLKTSGFAATRLPVTSSSVLGEENRGIKVNRITPRRTCKGHVLHDSYGEVHVSRLLRCCVGCALLTGLTGDGVNVSAGRDKTSSSEPGGRTRHQSELAHTSLHRVFGMKNMLPDCSGAAESWLAQERSRQYGR